MPVVMRRATYADLTDKAERADQAEDDRDRWEVTATTAVATAKTVAKAVDSALCALAIVHDVDGDGVCSCGHVSPCPTGAAVAELLPYWESQPAHLDAYVAAAIEAGRQLPA